MNIALVLSGGTGTRMGLDIPKQYCPLLGKPVIVHTLGQFEGLEGVDYVITVAAPEWEMQLWEWKDAYGLSKLRMVAPAGENRQMSIRNGLAAAQPLMGAGDGGVIIQDAARPLTSRALLSQLLAGLEEVPAVMPALPITDTTYTSRDGQWVDGLLDRSTLFAGQAPEAFRYWPYLKLYRDTPTEELCAMSGSSQLPYRAGWEVKVIPGERENVKITYPADLRACEGFLRERGASG